MEIDKYTITCYCQPGVKKMSEYYTVTEFASKYGKDPGSIRRMLLKGVLKGEKLGKQWIISKSTEYPADARIKSGKYVDWRKTTRARKKSPELMRKLSRMCASIGVIYGEHIEKIVLYGSYARGEQGAESDIDIAVLIKGGSTEDMHDAMTDLVVDYELDIAKTLSVVSIEYENYLEWRRVLPFYKNLDREGIVLWKAA